MKKIINAIVVKNKEIATNIYDMTLDVGNISKYARCGSFVMLYPNSQKNLLPRPISICEVDEKNNMLRLVYQKIGEGTALFSSLKKGNSIKMLGICGNGYDISRADGGHILIGGGIGIPPLLETCKRLKGEKTVVLGFRDKTFLVDEFRALGADVYVATDSGKEGFKGNVIELIKDKKITGKNIYACGPTPMLKAISSYAKANNFYAQVSIEERMACGIGACVCCVAKVKKGDGYSFEKVCKNGPVFNAMEVF